MALKTYNFLQPSFATGIISEDVGSRVDLNKYQAAILKGDNIFIRPYGGFYKRQGSIYLGKTKNNSKAILKKFSYSDKESYLLEFGNRYVRVWRNGEYTGIEIVTPYLESDINYLRTAQSADVMYIASGRFPVKTLSRYSDTDWRFEDIALEIAPFQNVNKDKEIKISLSATTGEDIVLSATHDVFTNDMIGSQLKIVHDVPTKEVSVRYGDKWTGDQTSEEILVGKSWSFLTSGSWGGRMELWESKDGIDWGTTSFRKFYGSKDFNANVNGTVDKPVYMKITSSLWGTSSNGARATLTSYAYTHEGVVKIKAINNSKEAIVDVIKFAYSTEPTDLWYESSWSDKSGYPVTVSFFQDRLAFGGTKKQPNGIWFSRTGDYPSYETETKEGKVLADSALQFNILAREMFDIRHILPAQDFIVFTSGNEWIISGDTILKPDEINPKMQTAWGSAYVEPLFIGNRIVYIQRRGGKVRDMGYSFESDNYTGDDLSIFIRHLTEEHSFQSATFCKQPDSMIFFVRDDGVMLCLTYIREQEVFAWSVLKTFGKYESVLSIPEGETDTVYTVVERIIDGKSIRYIEKFAHEVNSDNPSDHIMLDCSKVINNTTKSTVIKGLEHLKGRAVQVIGDENLFIKEGFQVTNDGTLELPYGCNKVIVGLGYKMEVEFCDVVIEIDGFGSTQGVKKTLNSATFKVVNSFGGQIYTTNKERTSDIFTTAAGGGNILEEDLKLRLLSKNEKVTLPQDTNDTAKLCLVHDEAFPFSLASLTREVVIG